MNWSAHAYLARGGGETLLSALKQLIADGVIREGSPDLFTQEYRQLTIDDARALSERAALRPLSNARRVFVIAAATLTSEAQNALLKTLEDPPANAFFLLIVPSPHMLLLTLRSRLISVQFDDGSQSVYSPIDATEFLNTSPDKRIALLAPILEADERDVGGALAFLSALEVLLEKKISLPEGRSGLHAVYRAKAYITDKGSLIKALLEQVALLLPKS